MQNEWNDEAAQDLGDDPIALRDYSARLLSQTGTTFRLLTSVKFDSTNVFGEEESFIRIGGGVWVNLPSHGSYFPTG